MAQLRKNDCASARALEFTILTAARTNEAIGAPPQEFDLRKRDWTVPAHRIKAGKLHKVPLPQRAVEIVKAQPEGVGRHLQYRLSTKPFRSNSR